MMLTTEGLLMYDSYMEGPFDEGTDTTASGLSSYEILLQEYVL